MISSSTIQDPTASHRVNVYRLCLEPRSPIWLTTGSVSNSSECSVDTFTLHYPTQSLTVGVETLVRDSLAWL